MTSPLPSIFLSHGAPTFASNPGVAGPLLAALGKAIPKPDAVIVVSPHWMTPQVLVSAAVKPPTIHDFGGFPANLYSLQYPVPGHPHLAARTVEVLKKAGWKATEHPIRGLDHGAWIPLRYIYPLADVPVFQVSMPSFLNATTAFLFGQALAPLAWAGAMIVGSGSLTHNLSEFGSADAKAYPYVDEFVRWIQAAILRRDTHGLVNAMNLAPHALRAHPTVEHFLPLLVALGAAPNLESIAVIEGGVQHDVLSMESYVFGWGNR